LVSIVLLVLIGGCGGKTTEPAQSVVGRWRVIDKQGIDVPNSFFWFVMDYVEFRNDGIVLALVVWPPETGSEVRLNKTAEYYLVGEQQIAFVGACRHQDPCTGTYTVTLKGDELRISDAGESMTLERVGPPSNDLPPPVVGPSPSPTPTSTG
jgi:hypothetical protein